jgi:PKD repeat protein
MFYNKLQTEFQSIMKKIYSLFLGMVIITSSFAQQQHRCATMEVDARLKATNPEYIANRNQIDEHAHAWASSPQSGQRILVTIPVVFHVVYQNATENISDAKLQSQLDVLNEDFRKLNVDFSTVPSAFQGAGADMEIQFCLATVDAAGNPTTGITRTQTTDAGFDTDDQVKYTAQGGQNAWDRNKYLNIWVCDMSAAGLLGYAQFPGGPAATDGVVLTYNAVGRIGVSGPYNKGRTATHEVGHWLNLYHIWGDDGGSCNGSDQVSDTPNQAGANYGCETFPFLTNCAPNSPGEMFMNYMDYGDDVCLKMFTNGQKTRAQSLFATGGSRVGLLSSNACSIAPPPTVACTDTLNYPLEGTVNVFLAGTGQTGYVGGVNSYGDVAKVDQFTATAPITSLTGARFSFGIATQGTAPAGSIITVKAYAYTAAGPSTVLATTTIPLSTIIANVNAGTDTYASFATPVTVTGNFFLGIEFDPAAGYTLSLKSNSDGDPAANTAWEQFGDLSWHQFSETPASWGISVNQAIFPILTSIAPVASFSTTTSTTICAGQTVSYAAQASGSAYNWTFTGGTPATSTAQNPTVTYNSSGSYGASLVVTGVCTGQSATQTQNSLITVSQAPIQPVLTLNNGVISSGVTVGSFQWFLNGVAISGATSSTYTPSQTGTYTVVVSNTSGNCTKTSSGLSYTSTVGIFDATGDVYINIYPNPAKDILTIQTGFHAMQENVVCSMFDLSGKLVYQHNYENVMPDALLQVELSSISNGMYQVVISTSAGRSVSRVAVAR